MLFSQWGSERAARYQLPFLLGMVFQVAGNDTSDGLVAVADQDLFAVFHELNMSAEPRLQVADIYGSHSLL